MTDNFRILKIKHSYTGKGEKILTNFLLPVLEKAVTYDRVTSFYSIESLIAISQGIESLYERSGKMRLIIGLHSFPVDIAKASLDSEYLKSETNKVRDEIASGLKTIHDELIKKRVAAIAWMIEDGLLEVKTATVEGGIFHPKTLLFKDNSGNRIAAVGSSNETGAGLGGNYEQLMVATSWDTLDAVNDQEQFFNSLWSGTNEEAIVLDITESVAEAIIQGLGSEYRKDIFKEKNQTLKVFAKAIDMPSNFFVSGHIPALFQHQERAVIDALSRWPVRVMFSDEVGLGKTYEAAATMAYLMKYGGVKRTVILTPKSVLQQWQDELYYNFGMEAWLYDSIHKQYISPTGKVISMYSRGPIYKTSPDLMLISAQFARGGKNRKHIFEKSGVLMPDLLILDEAHTARVRKDIDGSTKSTKMYDMVKSICGKIPHIILATATPMQKDALEYHSMLKLLGLPESWQKTRAYDTSLHLIAANDIPDLNDAHKAGKLVRSTLTVMKPSFKELDNEEIRVANELLKLDINDSFVVADFVQTEWNVFQRLFIKLHPAHLLTVRNTRKSLEDVGYIFPKRNLIEESVNSPTEVLLLYQNVNEYISDLCFSVEKILHPDKKMNTGFIQVNYQQRVASSLYSCKKSLSRRQRKLRKLKDYLIKKEKISTFYRNGIFTSDDMDEFDEDDFLFSDMEDLNAVIDTEKNIDFGELAHAIELEMTSISPLLNQIDRIIEKYGDMKIKRSIQVAINYLKNDDKVLLFSRYTDTVEALIKEFEKAETYIPFGIFTGKESSIVINGTKTVCSKEDIKNSLRTGNIKIMFCSDAASEGLNLQSARVLINVDVPWTPSRLEQRIGRIARLGQQASEVDIHNVWYPTSIEARMYKRIQKRLDMTNLAIGEFPEVVAESIKTSILKDEEIDNSMEELLKIRNSTQTKALERLWSQTDATKTLSGVFRNKLIDICKEKCEKAELDIDTGAWHFSTFDGMQFYATPLEGQEESISIETMLKSGLDSEIKGLRVVKDEDENPCAFGNIDKHGEYVDFEGIPDLVLGKESENSMPFQEIPEMLPVVDDLDMSFALNKTIPKKPKLWVGEEK